MEPLGVEQILVQAPETLPEILDRSPAPIVHAATRKIRKELREAYGWFVAAYKEAAHKLRKGDRNLRPSFRAAFHRICRSFRPESLVGLVD